MKKILFLSLLFISINLEAKILLSIKPLQREVIQGDLVSARIEVADNSQNIDLLSLENKTISNSIYFFEIKKESSGYGAKLVIANVPKENTVTDKLGAEDIVIDLSGIQLVPTEKPKSFIYDDFKIPTYLNWVLIIGITLALVLVTGGVIVFIQKLKKDSNKKKKITKIKEEVLSAKTYDEVVKVWTMKHEILQLFPNIDVEFKGLEQVLYAFLFKPSQSQDEKRIAEKAFQDFIVKIKGKLDGV